MRTLMIALLAFLPSTASAQMVFQNYTSPPATIEELATKVSGVVYGRVEAIGPPRVEAGSVRRTVTIGVIQMPKVPGGGTAPARIDVDQFGGTVRTAEHDVRQDYAGQPVRLGEEVIVFFSGATRGRNPVIAYGPAGLMRVGTDRVVRLARGVRVAAAIDAQSAPLDVVLSAVERSTVEGTAQQGGGK